MGAEARQDAVGDPPGGSDRIARSGDGRWRGDELGDVRVESVRDHGAGQDSVPALLDEVELQVVRAQQRRGMKTAGEHRTGVEGSPDAAEVEGLVGGRGYQWRTAFRVPGRWWASWRVKRWKGCKKILDGGGCQRVRLTAGAEAAAPGRDTAGAAGRGRLRGASVVAWWLKAGATRSSPSAICRAWA